MTAVYFIASLFVVGNFVLCFHEDGGVYLELSKVQPAATIADENAADAIVDCDDTDCADSAISDFTLNAAGAKLFDTDTSKSHLVNLTLSHSLTVEAATHNGWRSGPPATTVSLYTSILKPTLILQV